jgi:penicillin-binding protein 1B
MAAMGSISLDQATEAKATPLQLIADDPGEDDAPYFVDMVGDQLAKTYSESDLTTQAFRVYSTLDLDLQHVAREAVDEGMRSVDNQLAKQRGRSAKNQTGSKASLEDKTKQPGAKSFPQVALIALDPHTGDVLALVGGRNYASSQLNHLLAKRPTGSIFKPFVYAAAVNTALSGRTFAADPNDPLANGEAEVFGPLTRVDDSQVSISYGGETYEPRNYHERYHGFVSARYALAQSLNNATVRVAQMIGFGAVASLAKAAGISGVQPTPSIALGAYDATPLDMAGAYTVFANQGVRVSPRMVTSVHSAEGEVISEYHSDTKPVLDPRVAYVLTDMMSEVLDSGTGYAVRSRGFHLPAAGKTGTSHDAWFAGYTPNLLCVIWIGNDDYTDLELSGGATAAPIWAEFMKRASKLPRYRDTKYFPQPPGLAAMKFDSNSGHVKTASCPQSVAGDEPTQSCEEAPKNRDLGAAGSDGGNLSGQDFPLASATVAEPWSNHVSTATSAAVTVPRN